MAEHAHSTRTLAPGNPPSRRLVLSAFTGAAFAGTAVVLAPPAASAENPDTELIAAAGRIRWCLGRAARNRRLAD